MSARGKYYNNEEKLRHKGIIFDEVELRLRSGFWLNRSHKCIILYPKIKALQHVIGLIHHIAAPTQAGLGVCEKQKKANFIVLLSPRKFD